MKKNLKKLMAVGVCLVLVASLFNVVFAATTSDAFKDMLDDASEWASDGGKSVTVEDGVVTSPADCVSTHEMGDIYNKPQTFMLKVDMSSGNWDGFGFRQSQIGAVPWDKDQDAGGYHILVKDTMFELQKYDDSSKIWLETFEPNDVMTDPDKFYEVTYACINQDDGSVKITFSVEGTEVINYVDSDSPLMDQGDFIIFSKTADVQIKAVPEASSGGTTSPSTGDPSMLIYAAVGLAGIAGTGFAIRKRK